MLISRTRRIRSKKPRRKIPLRTDFMTCQKLPKLPRKLVSSFFLSSFFLSSFFLLSFFLLSFFFLSSFFLSSFFLSSFFLSLFFLFSFWTGDGIGYIMFCSWDVSERGPRWAQEVSVVGFGGGSAPGSDLSLASPLAEEAPVLVNAVVDDNGGDLHGPGSPDAPCGW